MGHHNLELVQEYLYTHISSTNILRWTGGNLVLVQGRLSNFLSVNLLLPGLGLLLRSFFHVEIRHWGLNPTVMNFNQYSGGQAQ